jgi:hypothetical protein
VATEILEALAKEFDCKPEDITHCAYVCEYLKDDRLKCGWGWSNSAIWQIEGLVRRLLVAVMGSMSIVIGDETND